MSEVTDTKNQPARGLTITGFVLGIASFVVGIIPVLGSILAALGLAFSIRGLVKKSLPGMAVAGTVISAVAIIPSILYSILAIGAISSPSNGAACFEIQEPISQVGTVVDYMEADITAMNLVGQYDLESIKREAEVLKLESKKLLNVSGTAEFNLARDNLYDGLTDLADAIKSLGGSSAVDAISKADAAVKAAGTELERICD